MDNNQTILDLQRMILQNYQIRARRGYLLRQKGQDYAPEEREFFKRCLEVKEQGYEWLCNEFVNLHFSFRDEREKARLEEVVHER